GPEEALQLMRAQNEPPETVVRVVREPVEGEPTDVPGALRVARVDEQALAEGRIWPQSRGSQLAGLAVGSRPGERVLDLCAPPGGTIVYSVCTINADENEAVVDESGLEVDTSLADEWPQFRHPRRPELLLTLPHRHGTSGFFVARLRV